MAKTIADETDAPAFNRRKLLLAGLGVAAMPVINFASTSPAEASAASLGRWQPKFYRFKLGDFEITTISDSEAFIDGPSRSSVKTPMKQMFAR